MDDITRSLMQQFNQLHIELDSLQHHMQSAVRQGDDYIARQHALAIRRVAVKLTRCINELSKHNPKD